MRRGEPTIGPALWRRTRKLARDALDMELFVGDDGATGAIVCCRLAEPLRLALVVLVATALVLALRRLELPLLLLLLLPIGFFAKACIR